PGVRGDAPRLAGAARGEHDRTAAQNHETPRFAEVGEHSGDALPVFQEPNRRALHVKIDALVHTVILERANELEARAVADVREARVAMTAEVALADEPFLRAIEDGAPFLELFHALGGLLRVKLGHAPDVQHLAAAHRVAEMHLPVVA